MLIYPSFENFKLLAIILTSLHYNSCKASSHISFRWHLKGDNNDSQLNDRREKGRRCHWYMFVHFSFSLRKIENISFKLKECGTDLGRVLRKPGPSFRPKKKKNYYVKFPPPSPPQKKKALAPVISTIPIPANQPRSF